jgi:mannosyltransferase OCH1-like enzyme
MRFFTSSGQRRKNNKKRIHKPKKKIYMSIITTTFILLLIVLTLVFVIAFAVTFHKNSIVLCPPETDLKIMHFPLKNDHEGREINEIPCNIIQTYISHHIPCRMSQAINMNISKNENWNHLYFDDIDSHLLMQKHFPGEINDAYEKLIPGAFKSDLFRLCAVYLFGGCYMDATMLLETSLDLVVQPFTNIGHKLIIPTDDPAATFFPLYQAFFLSTKNNPVLMKILQHIVKLIQSNHEPIDCLSYTGPATVGRAINQIFGRLPESQHVVGEPLSSSSQGEVIFLRHTLESKILMPDNTTIVATTKYEDWRKDRPSGSHYSDHVRAGNVYFPCSIRSSSGIINRLPESDNIIIPLVIVQTKNTTSSLSDIKDNFDSFDDLVGFNHVFFTDIERRHCVSAFGNDVLCVYDTLSGEEERVELWRSCYLYTNGGIYVNINISLENPTVFTDLFLNNAVDLVVTDSFFLLACRAGHPFLKGEIDRITTQHQKKPTIILPTSSIITLTHTDNSLYFKDVKFAIITPDKQQQQQQQQQPVRRCRAMTDKIFSVSPLPPNQLLLS